MQRNWVEATNWVKGGLYNSTIAKLQAYAASLFQLVTVRGTILLFWYFVIALMIDWFIRLSRYRPTCWRNRKRSDLGKATNLGLAPDFLHNLTIDFYRRTVDKSSTRISSYLLLYCRVLSYTLEEALFTFEDRRPVCDYYSQSVSVL